MVLELELELEPVKYLFIYFYLFICLFFYRVVHVTKYLICLSAWAAQLVPEGQICMIGQ